MDISRGSVWAGM